MLDPGGSGSYVEGGSEDPDNSDYEPPEGSDLSDDGWSITSEVQDVVDPSTSASDGTEVFLRSLPFTSGFAYASDAGEVLGGEDVTDTTGYEASEGAAEQVRTVVEETTETVKETVVPDLPDWLPFALGAPVVLGILAVLAYAFGQLVTLNKEV